MRGRRDWRQYLRQRRIKSAEPKYLRQRFKHILSAGGAEALVEEFERRAAREGGERWSMAAQLQRAWIEDEPLPPR
jgi:hypothetical protein